MRKYILSVSSFTFLALLLAGCVGDTEYSPSCPDPEVALGYWTAMWVAGRPAIIDTVYFSGEYYENDETLPTVKAYRGMPEWSYSFDTTDPGVSEYFAALTNGVDENLAAKIVLPNGWSRDFARESTGLRGGVTGDYHPDLKGAEVTRVMYHFIALVFDHPGEDPNNDGIWTDYVITVNIEFWGHLEE